MNLHTSSTVRVASLLVTTALMICFGIVAKASLVVANNGTDSSSCGSSVSPCRSISQAIENASSGETIWVGPGIYGDLSGDGNFDAPGPNTRPYSLQGRSTTLPASSASRRR